MNVTVLESPITGTMRAYFLPRDRYKQKISLIRQHDFLINQPPICTVRSTSKSAHAKSINPTLNVRENV